MSRLLYRYQFDESVPSEDVEIALVMALFAVEALHGESAVRLEARHALDAEKRSCVIEASTTIGCDFNRLFVDFVRREMGADDFTVTRIVDEVRANNPAALPAGV